METTERWLPIPDWRGWYEASDHGRIRSVDRVVRCRDGRVQRWRPVVLTPGVNSRGYLEVKLRRPGRKDGHLVHALVLRAFVGPPPEGMECCHRNRTPTDNRLVNLRWGTRSDNNRDAVEHGTNWQTAKAACPVDHLLISPNLTASSVRKGHRDCLACHRARAARCKAIKYGRPFDFRAAADFRYRKIMGVAV